MVENPSDTYNILAIDDEPFFLDFIAECLPDHDVTCCCNGEVLEPIDFSFDMVILDVSLDGESGYDLCKKIREQDSDVPILFVSAMKDLESRLKAYGAGGDDYITKPFQCDELIYKVNVLVKSFRRTLRLRNELDSNSLLMRDIQRESSDIHVINRFTMSSSQCKDIHTIVLIFFHTLSELGLEGVLQLNGFDIQSSTEQFSHLETDILALGEQLPRIHSFGRHRALFNWENCRLLVRHIGPHIDTVALLMDALEASVDRITHEEHLLEQIVAIEQHSSQIKSRLAETIEQMKDKISDELLNLGVVYSLTWEEEERIKEILDKYTREFQIHFVEQEMYNCNLRDAIDSLRAPHPKLYQQLESILNQSDDGLF